jgi:hypothetical protein
MFQSVLTEEGRCNLNRRFNGERRQGDKGMKVIREKKTECEG